MFPHRSWEYHASEHTPLIPILQGFEHEWHFQVQLMLMNEILCCSSASGTSCILSDLPSLLLLSQSRVLAMLLMPGHWTPCLSGYTCLISGTEKIPFSQILGWKNTPYFGKDEEIFAVINVSFFPDFEERLEREFRDPFQTNWGGPLGILSCYLIHTGTFIKCTLFEDFMGVSKKYPNWWFHRGVQQKVPLFTTNQGPC